MKTLNAFLIGLLCALGLSAQPQLPICTPFVTCNCVTGPDTPTPNVTVTCPSTPPITAPIVPAPVASTLVSGAEGPQVPFGFVGMWTPPAVYGTVISSPMIFPSAYWTTPAAQLLGGQPVCFDFATTLGQQAGCRFVTWGSLLQFTGCTSGLYAPGYNEPTRGPSTSIASWSVSGPSETGLIPLVCATSGTALAALQTQLGALLQQQDTLTAQIAAVRAQIAAPVQ